MTIPDALDVVRTIASVISTCAIVIATKSFNLQRKIWMTAHERSRGEKAIEVIRNFNSTLTVQSAATNRLVEILNTQQLKDLDEGRPFSILSLHKNDVQAALSGKILDILEDRISITGEQSYQLRFQALEVLNAVEIACQAWKLDVGDRKAIESEIEFLYDPSLPEPTTLQRNYRNVFNGYRFYPALYEFTKHLDIKRQNIDDQILTTVPRPTNIN